MSTDARPDTLVVLMGDEVAGELVRLPGGNVGFEYAPDYVRDAAATPLSVGMPLAVTRHPDHVVKPWLWGLLPDNDRVLDEWAKRYRVSASSPFALLSTPVGEDCAGAVRFVAPDRFAAAVDRPGTVRWLTDHEMTARLAELRRDRRQWLGSGLTGQFSLAGAQAKMALVLRKGRFGEPSGRIPTTHIVKPAVAGFHNQDLNEHLCLATARHLGIATAKSEMLTLGSETALVVERYDRKRVGRSVVRVHQEDLCQALGLHPRAKYQNEGGPSPKEIATLFRRVMPPEIAMSSIWRFADALAFNWLIGGTDAHAKNYSLLIEGSEVRLAPLYDIASMLPYEHERGLKMAMKLGGSYLVDAVRNPWPKAARELGLPARDLVARVEDLAVRCPDALAAAIATAAAPGVLGFTEPFLHLVSTRAERCARILGG